MIYRILVLNIVVLLIPMARSQAAPITFDDPPVSYVPGYPLAFEVIVPPISNLGSYNIDLVLTSPTGVAGADFFFDVAATMPVEPGYVFPMTTYYFDAVNLDSMSEHRLSLTDFDFSGSEVVSGVNDRVARVVIATAANFNDDLTLFVDTSGLILDTPDLSPTPVQEFGTIKTDTEAAGSVLIAPIPEPPTVALALLVPVLCPFIRFRIRSR